MYYVICCGSESIVFFETVKCSKPFTVYNLAGGKKCYIQKSSALIYKLWFWRLSYCCSRQYSCCGCSRQWPDAARQ